MRSIGFPELLVIIGVIVCLVVFLKSRSKGSREAENAENARRANETPGERYSRLHGAFRGELGSPGTSPSIVGKHSGNCECKFCLHRT